MIALIHAHPYPDRSRANRALLGAASRVPTVAVRSLYDLYPDFAVDVAAEQEALAAADVIVWQHPVFWYAPPALMKLWFEQVLTLGWAFGEGGRALAGKRCLWVPTTGGDAPAYVEGGHHGHPFAAYVAPVAQTARYCGLEWLEPFIVHGAHRQDEAALALVAERYRARLEGLAAPSGPR